MSAEPEIESEWYFTAADGVAGAAASGTPYSEQPPVSAGSPLNTTMICVLVLADGSKRFGVCSCSELDGEFDAERAKSAAKRNALVSNGFGTAGVAEPTAC